MKSLMRCLTLVMVVALVLMMTPALTVVNAQADNCFGLAQADCDLLKKAGDSAQMAKLTSFVMDYAISFKLTGTGTSDVDFSVTGNGPFAVDSAKVSGASSDPMAALSAFTIANTMNASFTGMGQSQKGTFEFRIVDGFIYFKGDVATQDKWMKLSLAKAMGSMSSNPAMSGAMNPSSNPAAAVASDPAVLEAVGKLVTTPGFITAKRDADVTIDGVKAAALTFNIDLLTLVKSKDFAPILKAIAKSQGSTQELDEKQLSQFVAVASMILKDTKLSFTEYVGADDGVSRGLNITFSMKIDEQTAAMLGASAGSTPSAINIDFKFDVKLSKVGEAVKVEAVADATEVDTSSMMGGSGGMAATPAK